MLFDNDCRQADRGGLAHRRSQPYLATRRGQYRLQGRGTALPFDLRQTDGLGPVLQGCGLWVLQDHALQHQSAGGHGIGRVDVAPFDERGQATTEQALAVVAHAQPPLQQAGGCGS